MAEQRLQDIAGWPVVHRFFRLERGRWLALSPDARRAAAAEFAARLGEAAGETDLQFVPMAPIAKADFAFMAVHPEPARLQRLEQRLSATVLGACLVPVHAFLSMSEVSEYMSTAADHARQLIEEQGMDPTAPEFARSLASFKERMAAYAEARVHPQLPTDMPLIGFYPMGKARDVGRNWYTLPFAERRQLMGGHAATGRKFAGRVLQLITSSTGLDDWEWGVTLFARDLKSIRDVVYEMRFDPGSAIYGQFGEFYVALRIRPEEIAETLQL